MRDNLTHGVVGGVNVRPRMVSFTLVELLVVIAILLILAALLAPSLRLAKTKGKQIVCMNNLRNLYLAARIYNEERGQWVIYADWSDSGYWFQHLCPNKTGNYKLGPLASDTTHDALWKVLSCPANTALWPSGWAGWEKVNYIVNASKSFLPGAGGQIGDVKTEITPWMTDGTVGIYWDDISLGSYVCPVHGNGANVLYFDGHITWHKQSKLNDVLYTASNEWN